MTRSRTRLWISVAAITLTTCCATVAAQAETEMPKTENKNLPRVLIIGDSVSIGYTEPVSRMLDGKAIVQRVPENCQSTVYAREHIKTWIGNEHWDVIHFNWGIWDTHELQDGYVRTTPDEYAKNLRQLVAVLKSTGAKLIWASTTPVGDIPGFLGVRGADVSTYNAVAAKIMRKNKIPIDDLNSTMKPRVGEFRLPDLVHYKPEGSEFLARQVADSILSAIDAAAKEQHMDPSAN